MAATNPRARSYFSKLMSKTGDATPRPEPVVEHAEEVEVVEPISWVEAIEPLNDDHTVLQAVHEHPEWKPLNH